MVNAPQDNTESQLEERDLRLVPVTIEQKLAALLGRYALTSEQVARAVGCAPRSIELRRKRPPAARGRESRYDLGIDQLHSVMSLLVERRKIEIPLARAFVFGLSAYLEDQAPAAFLAAGDFELVRSAALAFAGAEDPVDFVEVHGPIPRIAADTVRLTPPAQRRGSARKVA